MIITFKTLQRNTFKIEIEENVKVKVLKEKIAAERGDEFPVEGQKLIYAGKILDDDKIVGEYNIDPDKNFVVVMASKPKKSTDKPKEQEIQPLSSTSGGPSTDDTTPPSTAAASVTTALTTPSTVSATETSPQAATSDGNGSADILTGSALETSITELMSLGYSREQVLRALNASYLCADRAAEYLLSGNIPDNEDEDADTDVPAGGQIQAAGSVATANQLQFLRCLPQFQAMRRQLQDHPETLPQLLQEIGRSNPQLLTMISQNQEAFIALLNEPVGSEGTAESGGGDVGSGGSVAGGGGAGGLNQAPGGGFQIQVTPEEKAAIERVVAMGFPEPEVIQAFFACDKNEELTVNFLLNSM